MTSKSILSQYLSLILLPAFIFMSASAQADVASDLTAFVNSVGGASSSTPASIYQGQSRGYINGGRLFVRVPQRSTSLVSARAPRFTAGCGGIDAFGGSLSFISAAELVNTLKSIGTSAGSYLLMLGLRTISSQISNTMEKAFDWLQSKVNLDINSCEAAASLVGGLGSAMGMNNQEVNVCIVQTMESSGSDYSTAKDTCTTGGGSKTAANNDRTRELSFVEGNLAWMAMQKSTMFTGDNDMKRLAMSLTGTIVKRQVKDVGGLETTVGGDADSQSKTEVFPSILLTDQTALDVLLTGGTVTRYGCGDSMTGANGCRDVINESWSLPASVALIPATRTALMSLYNSIRNRTDPASGDINYVAETAIPAMRIVRTAALLGDNGLGIQIIDDYSEQIAVELLSTYINGIVAGVAAYSFDESFGDEGAKLREGIEMVQRQLFKVREQAKVSITRSLEVAEQMEYYERIIISTMPRNIARSLAWSNGRS